MLLIILGTAVLGYIISHLLIVSHRQELHRSHYAHSGPWNVLKLALSHLWVRWRLVRPHRMLDVYKPTDMVYEKTGLVPTETEKFWEAPKPLKHKNSVDGAYIYGTDGSGTFLTLVMERYVNREARIVLILSLADGTTYQLPGSPDALHFNTDGKDSFNGAGLKLVVLEPMRRWRVLLNGLAKKTTKGEESIVHLRLNMIWAALSRPFEFRREFSRKLLAQAIARENWNGTKKRLQITEPSLDGFDQWGVVHGIYQESESTETEVYLRGLRQRRWGQPDPSTLHRKVEFMGLTDEGVFFYINGTSDSARLTHEVWGHSMHPTGVLHKINYCDLDLEQLGEFEQVPRSFSIRFATKGHQYNMLVNPKPEYVTTMQGRPWLHQTTHLNCELALNGCQGRLLLLATGTYKGSSSPPVETSLPYLGAPQRALTDSDKEKLILTFEEEACCFESLVGGKGSSLALLSQMRENRDLFEVPKGFCLTLAAWRKQTSANENLQTAIEHIEKIARGVAEGKLEKKCREASNILREAPVDRDIQNHVYEALLHMFGKDFENKKFAVRSSAIGEDGEELSSAGQNETVLGSKGLNEILTGIQKCWSSLLEFRSVEYRRQHGAELVPGMGLVVQEMVEADSAGVLFTVDPVTGNPSRVFITVNYGLGESVVSGQTEPDTLILNRTLDQIFVHQRTVGKKHLKIVMKDSGVSEVELNEEESKKFSLTDDVALKLGDVGILLELSSGTPKDIEFAVAGNKIFLLQSRPITTLESWTDYEIGHENDTPVLTSQEHITSANTGEVMPGTTSTLSQTVTGNVMELGMQRAMKERYGDRFDYNPWYQGRFFCNIAGHSFINVIELLLRENQAQITDMNRAADISFFGHLTVTPEIHRAAVNRHGIVDFKGQLNGIKGLANLLLFGKKKANAARAKFSEYSIDYDKGSDSKELLEEIRKHLPELVHVLEAHSVASTLSSVWQMFCFLALLKGEGDWSAEFNNQMAEILSAINNVESANVPAAMEEIAEAILASSERQKFTEMNLSDATVWLKQDSNAPGRLFQEFIKRHGHRGMKELDLYNKPWALDMEAVVSSLQAMVKNSRPSSKSKHSFDWQAWRARVKFPSYCFLRFAIPRAREGVCLREQTKTLLVRTVHIFRLSFLRLGQQLFREGKLPDPELIFFLTQTELTEIVQQGHAPSYVRKAVKRRKMYPVLDKLVFPKFVKGVPKPIEEDYEIIELPSGTSVQLQATPGCKGIVRGTARVILHISDAGQIQPGDILITRGTDIGWGPYFPLLSGLVTEKGGVISHGVVVAREYGLPCIIGADNATKLFRSGVQVLLDGNKGTLTSIDNTDDQHH